MDPNETKVSDEHNIDDFTKKISSRVKSNVKRTEHLENIDEFVKNNSIGKDISFPLPKEDITAAQVYTHWAGKNWSSDFRGLNVNNQIERRVLYLQDGKKLNDSFHFGEFYSDIYTDMDRIEKIEVIKGPGAALYGNNSITGVVNIITRKPTKKNEMELITEYDSVLKNLTTRALYYSKFSDKLSISLDASKFEGKGLYTSGNDSWGAIDSMIHP